MAPINFKPIFDYIDQSVRDLKSEVASKADIERIMEILEPLSKLTKDTTQEIQVAHHRIDRLDGWAGLAAEKTGIPYNLN